MPKPNPNRSRVYRELDAMKRIAYEIDGLHFITRPYGGRNETVEERIDHLGRERAVAWLIAYFDLPFDRRPDPPPAPLIHEVTGDGYKVDA